MMIKTLRDMTPGELLSRMFEAPKATERMAALREYERRKAKQAERVRAAIETMIDSLGLPEALTQIAAICEKRAKSDDPAEEMRWTVIMDAVRNAADVAG